MVEIISARSFTIITTTEEGGDERRETFEIPFEITTWQSLKAMGIIGKLTRKVSEPAAKLLNAIVSHKIVDGESEGEKKKSIMESIRAALNGELLDSVPEGLADLLEGLADDMVPSKLMAVFFLKKNEAILGEAVFENRTKQFLEVPMRVLYEGLSDFFGKKANAKKSSASSSKIPEATDSENSTNA